jgi:hypothetical protein
MTFASGAPWAGNGGFVRAKAMAATGQSANSCAGSTVSSGVRVKF